MSTSLPHRRLKPRFGFPVLLLGLLAGIAVPCDAAAPAPYTVVLGIAQDGGFPHAGCQRECCQAAFENPTKGRFVSSLGIVDPVTDQRWLIDCTPDFRFQLSALSKLSNVPRGVSPLSGIFLTHAHIGHYSGLAQLGREVMGTRDMPVYAMPVMRNFLRTHGPWSQLVELKNIQLRSLSADQPIRLNERLTITPFLVPHRDEFSETVGFSIQGPRRSVLFIPDIDKWEKWDRSIEQMVVQSDRAYLDGTFYDGGELPGRDFSKIPHPFMVESMQRLVRLPAGQRSKVHFIHLNHTNPALQRGSAALRKVRKAGMDVSREGERFEL